VREQCVIEVQRFRRLAYLRIGDSIVSCGFGLSTAKPAEWHIHLGKDITQRGLKRIRNAYRQVEAHRLAAALDPLDLLLASPCNLRELALG
jgi:hypothetical protein